MELLYVDILLLIMFTYDKYLRYKMKKENEELEKTIDRMKVSESNLRDRELQLLERIKFLEFNKNIWNKN